VIPFAGKSFRVLRPAEPTDILWENLGGKGAFKRRLITNFVIFLMLLLCFVLIYASSLWKINLKSSRNTDESEAETIQLSLLLLIPALIVSCLNILLSRCIRQCALLEKHDTFTDYNSSVSIKLSFAMFMNSAIVPLCVYWDSWYGFNSLIMEIHNIILSNAVLSPLLYYVNLHY
jgi:heme/copper-type cytochrome/quinol oxidase subunit 2